MSSFYNIDGERISMREWSHLVEIYEYRLVAYDEVGDSIHVSTVWVGLDHSFFDGPPLIFETMVFTLKDMPYIMPSGIEYWWEGVEQYRYPTLAEAEAGHVKILEMVRVLEDVK